jgi:hypothetical protein
MDASTDVDGDDVDGDVQAGKALLVGMQAFLRIDTTGPIIGSLPQVAATRKMYVSPGITAHGNDGKTFAAKIGNALGPGNSFQIKRSACEFYDFAQDLIRLKELATCDEFAVLCRPFWDKDDSSSGGDFWAKTRIYRGMGLTFSKLPLLQLLNLSEDKMKRVGLQQYRFIGGTKKLQVPFHVRMAELLHVLPQELVKSTELAGQNEGIVMGDAGSEDASKDEADLRLDYKLVIDNLGALNRLFTPDVEVARAFTEDYLASARTSLAEAISDRETCEAIFRVLDHLSEREVPGDSDDYADVVERQVETQKLWQRFHRVNCKPLRKEATHLNDALGTFAAVREAHQPEEKQRRKVARKESSAKGQKEVFDNRLGAIFEEAALPPADEFDGDKPSCNRQFTIMTNTVAINYQLWRVEEDPERKAELCKLLPPSLIAVLEKPLPRYLEDMGASGVHGRFVDVDQPDEDGDYTHPQDTARFLPGGLTKKGYYSSGTFDVQGEEPDESDHVFLEGRYAGESILLKEFAPLKGGLDDLHLVRAIRMKLLLEFQIVKADSIAFGSSANEWQNFLSADDFRYHDSNEQIDERYAFVPLTADSAENRRLVWNRKLTRASRLKKGLLRKRKREEEDEEDEGKKGEDESEDEKDEEDEEESEEEEDEEDEEEKAKPKTNGKPKAKPKMKSHPWSSGEKGEGAVLKDNVVWSSTEDGSPLCTFTSFGTESRADGSIAMNLTSSDDEAHVFKSSEELQASLVATLDALTAAIAKKKAEIVNRGMHPEAAFTFTPAPAPALPSSSAASPTLQSQKKPKGVLLQQLKARNKP